MVTAHTHERRPAKFSRGVQAGRRCLRAAVLRVAAVLVRRVAHVKRGGLRFLIPFHSLRVEPLSAHTHADVSLRCGGGGIQRTSSRIVVLHDFFRFRALGAFRGRKGGEDLPLHLSFVVRARRGERVGRDERVRLSPTRVSSCRGGAAVRPYLYRQPPTKGADTGRLPRYLYCLSMAIRALVADCSHRRLFRLSPRWHCR